MRCLVEIARCESISAASRVLGVSQPALTRCVAGVESELGVELFARSPRGVSLTENGERFVAGAMRVLADVEGLVSEFPLQSGPLRGSLRIGLCPAGYGGYVRRAIREIAKSHPGVNIGLFGGPAEALCPRLTYGELDLIVGSSSYLERWKELEVHRLKRLHSVCVVRRGHPLSKCDRIQEIDVLRYPAILPSSVDPLHSDLAARHVEHGLAPFHPRYATDDPELIVQLVRESDAYFPLMSLDPDASELRRQFFTLRNVLRFPEHHLSIARTRQRKPARLADLFTELFTRSWTETD